MTSALAGALAAEELRILAPGEGAILVGPTTFRFAPPEGTDRVDVYVAGRLIGSALPPGWDLAWDAPASAVGTSVVAVAYAGGSVVGRARLDTEEIQFSDRIDVNTVQLYPTVRDRRGRLVTSLGESDFEVIDSGRPIQLDYFASSVSSLTVVLLLDVSDSMRPHLSTVRDAAIRLVGDLDPDDQLAVYSFDHGVHLASPLGASHQEAKEALFGLRTGGGTALFDAIVRVFQDLESVAGRKVIVLFSDGIDLRSLTSLTRAVDAARRSEVIIYPIGMEGTEAGAAGRDDLKALAEGTGGELFLIDRTRRLPEIFDTILGELRAQYLLSFTPRPGRTGWRSIEVRVRERGLRVRSRDSYFYEGP